jgi:hypothetical protein
MHYVTGIHILHTLILTLTCLFYRFILKLIDAEKG